MPYTGNQITVRPAILANRWELVDLHFSQAESGAPTVSVTYTPVFVSGGVSTPGDTTTYTTAAGPYLTLNPNGNVTLARNLKGLAFQILQDAGIIPTGGVVS